MRAGTNQLRKRTYNVQKNTGKTTNNGHVKVTGHKQKNGQIPPSEPWEPLFLEGLKDPEEARSYLNYCLREGELPDVLDALQSIAKAQGGLTKLARETGLSRVNLYSALSETGNPRFNSISKVLRSLGMQVTVEARRSDPPRAKRIPRGGLIRSERTSAITNRQTT